MQESTADTINDILRGVMAPGGFGQALVLDKPSAGKTGTIRRQHGGLVRRLHPDAGHRRDDRRRQPAGPLGHAERPDRRGHATSTSPTAPPSPARCGPSPCEPSRTPSPTPTSPRRRVQTAPTHGHHPRRHGPCRPVGPRDPRRPGFYVTSAAEQSSQRKGTVAETSPGCGGQRAAGLDDRDPHLVGQLRFPRRLELGSGGRHPAARGPRRPRHRRRHGPWSSG